MKHLAETELIDLLAGPLESQRAAHVETCDRCRAQAGSIKSMFELVAADEPPEPSPLFWEHFGRRVNERIDAPPATGATAWLKPPRLAAIVATIVLVFVVAIGFRSGDIPTPVQHSASVTDVAPSPLPTLLARPADDIESDAAWAVVRTAAEDLWYDEIQGEGLAAQPGSTERVAMELSAEERAELARLIESELKRTGA